METSVNIPATKTCTRCKLLKSSEEFSVCKKVRKNKKKPDKLVIYIDSKCKKCNVVLSQKYYTVNKEFCQQKNRERKKKRRQSTPKEVLLEKGRADRIKYKDTITNRKKIWYESNKKELIPKIVEYQKKWRSENPDKYKESKKRASMRQRDQTIWCDDRYIKDRLKDKGIEVNDTNMKKQAVSILSKRIKRLIKQL